uniref:Uncharacterized LOC100184952 n=1 Tax=Ciona intestinalis TaxID=7719 RepID=H2XTC0_CIOIN|nr:uncharacterized protein LOC100184952 [Ciona intestinalis]|eukprot:XP_002126084.1 uncharacterized protein LOC100184952 [Ciona intestinalis]
MDGANLNTSERQLALTLGADLKFKTMKSALKRVFGNTTPAEATPNIKEEVFTNRLMERKKTGMKKEVTPKKVNPRNKFGNVTRCVICDSKMHWVPTCPHKEQVMSTEMERQNVAINLQMDNEKMEVLSNEADGHAVVDTACTKTVSL